MMAATLDPKSETLMFLLIQIAALGEEDTLSEETHQGLRNFKDESTTWEFVYAMLKLCRVASLTYWAIQKHHLKQIVPAHVLQNLFQDYVLTLRKNKLNLARLNEILVSFKDREITPALWKGIVLATECYPDIGGRVMADIDFYVDASHRETVISVSKELGFVEAEFLNQAKKVYNCVDKDEILLDIHFGCEFFSDFSNEVVYKSGTNPEFGSSGYLTLEPNSFLALLIEHTNGHYVNGDGLHLQAFFDLLFFYRTYGKELELERLSLFLKSKENWCLLFRVNQFIGQITEGESIPFLEISSRSDIGLTLAEIQRSALVAAWELSLRRKAWLRLLLSRVGIVDKRYDIFPSFSDLLKWRKDGWKHRELVSNTKVPAG